MKPAVLKPFFGRWIVQTGEVVFPRMFEKKKEAQEVVRLINRRLTNENAERND